VGSHSTPQIKQHFVSPKERITGPRQELVCDHSSIALLKPSSHVGQLYLAQVDDIFLRASIMPPPEIWFKLFISRHCSCFLGFSSRSVFLFELFTLIILSVNKLSKKLLTGNTAVAYKFLFIFFYFME
jgi:hypothetical protein